MYFGRKKYWTVTFFLLLIGISSFLLYHQKNIKCIFIASNGDFVTVEDHIFVSKDTPLTFQNELLSLINYSQKTLQNFWKTPIEIPTIIYCHSFEYFQKLGAKNTLALCRLGEYPVISPNGLDHEILTHEMCHAVTFELLEQNYFKYYTQLPAWLDEGIALQFNTMNEYQMEELEKYKRLNINELKRLDRPRHFYSKDHQTTLENYKMAKLEVAQFLQKNQIDELKNLLQINSKKQFYKKYEQLRL
ncbi:MAG: hypothetical protein AAF806_00030 [Bacteroidota bacterium]